MPRTRVAAIALCCALAGCEAPQMPAESSISIVAQGANYDVTVPKSRVVLVVPKADLRREAAPSGGGASGSPRYFLFKGDDLIVSGWIEPARLHTASLDDSLKGEFAQLEKAGFGAPTNVEKMRVGSFDGVLYDVRIPVGNSSHIRATYLDADTWIDLHVSVSAKRSPAEVRAEVIDAVRRLAIVPKS
jgi:hypothetical protein